MNFRSAVFFRFPSTFEGLFQSPVAETFDALADQLSEARLKPVGPMELASQGFVSPYGTHAEVLVQRVGDQAGICIGSEHRLLPASVVNTALQKKVDEVLKAEGRELIGARTRKGMRDAIIAELLPRAFVQPGRTDAYFDFNRCFIAIDTASRKSAESVVSEVRRAAGSFPALPLNAETAPRAILTGWLSGDTLPEGLHLGDECELRDPADRGAVIKVANIALDSEEVQAHLSAGFQCTRLALVLEDRMSFVVGEDLTLRKVKMLDGAVDDLANEEREDVQQELDARFVLQTAEIGRVFDLLESAFKLSRLDEPEAASTAEPARAKARRERAETQA